MYRYQERNCNNITLPGNNSVTVGSVADNGSPVTRNTDSFEGNVSLARFCTVAPVHIVLTCSAKMLYSHNQYLHSESVVLQLASPATAIPTRILSKTCATGSNSEKEGPLNRSQNEKEIEKRQCDHSVILHCCLRD